ncbi:hypothetical protein TNCV_2069451 [Trichonephila clavipes]|uniref:Uncharacterized protein n=1 Tax=Trichonephila clavipes TaxID=2585209 RepID=A0A8X6W3E6_TRICX|nr:hypothetical protein TNCV_2069451 [Trichonephila clavipes]
MSLVLKFPTYLSRLYYPDHRYTVAPYDFDCMEIQTTTMKIQFLSPSQCGDHRYMRNVPKSTDERAASDWRAQGYSSIYHAGRQTWDDITVANGNGSVIWSN